MQRDVVISGVHIGEHSINPDAVMNELRERCVKKGYNFVTIRTGNNVTKPVIDDSYFIDSESERTRDRAEVEAGLMKPFEFRMKWRGERVDIAREMTGEM